jgi:glycosyltransferase involved in cell wall biosynthesis
LTPPLPPTPPPQRPFKLALLGTRGIPARYGGFETFAEQLAVRLVQKGHHVTVYAESDQANQPDTWYLGVRIRHIKRPHWGPATVIGYDWNCLLDAARHNHDLVYMLGYGAAWACWWVRKQHRQKIWINVDGLEWARSKWGLLARTYLRAMEWVSSWAPTRIIADAQAIAHHYQQRYPRGVPCACIAYGADVPHPDAALQGHPLPPQLNPQGYILVVARPEPENHLLEIIQGYLQSGVSWPLVIVGSVTPTNTYQRTLLSHASNQVRFVGGIYNPAALTALRLQAACHIHAHSVGGTNPSLLEAMACGNLILALDNPFNREVAADAALYFHTPRQLAAHIQAIHAAPHAWQHLQNQARQRIQTHYTWDTIAAAYEQLILTEVAS